MQEKRVASVQNSSDKEGLHTRKYQQRTRNTAPESRDTMEASVTNEMMTIMIATVDVSSGDVTLSGSAARRQLM